MSQRRHLAALEVFSSDEDEQSSPNAGELPKDLFLAINVERTAALAAPSSHHAARVAALASAAGSSSARGSSAAGSTLVALVEVLEAAGLVVTPTIPPPGTIPSAHSFLTVTSPESRAPLLVELDLGAHFTLPRTTPSFQRILAALPPIFVGTASQLRSLLTWLAARTRDAMEELDLEVPPWRTADALFHKWQLGGAAAFVGEDQSPLYAGFGG